MVGKVTFRVTVDRGDGVMVQGGFGATSLAALTHPSVTPNSACATPARDVSRPHRGPAQLNQQELEALGRLWCSLESGKIELLEDSIGGAVIMLGSGPIGYRRFIG